MLKREKHCRSVHNHEKWQISRMPCRHTWLDGGYSVREPSESHKIISPKIPWKKNIPQKLYRFRAHKPAWRGVFGFIPPEEKNNNHFFFFQQTKETYPLNDFIPLKRCTIYRVYYIERVQTECVMRVLCLEKWCSSTQEQTQQI